MKKTLLAGAAVAGLFATQAFASDAPKPYVAPFAPAPAASPVSGYVELYGQWMTTKNGEFGSSYDPWEGLGGAGRVNWWLSPSTSVQIDFQGMGIGSSGTDWEYFGWDVGGFAHLSHRNANHLFGVFVGDTVTTDWDWYYPAANNVVVGAEAQAYLGNFTIYGQVGYLRTTRSYYDYLSSMWFGNLEGRWFLTPNTKIAVNVGFATGDAWNDGTKYDLVNYGAEVEQKFGMSPLSAFVRWDGYSYYGLHDDVIKGGIRIAIGQPDLKTQDRKGATLKVDELPALWIKLSDY